jgi:hypothetical protein
MPSKCRFGAQRHGQGTPSSGTTLVRVTQGRRIYNALLNTRRVGAASDPRGVDRRSRARGEPERAPGDCRRSHAANARHRRMRPRCSGVFARAIAMTFAAGESRASASVTWSRDRRKFAESHTHDSFSKSMQTVISSGPMRRASARQAPSGRLVRLARQGRPGKEYHER